MNPPYSTWAQCQDKVKLVLVTYFFCSVIVVLVHKHATSLKAPRFADLFSISRTVRFYLFVWFVVTVHLFKISKPNKTFWNYFVLRVSGCFFNHFKLQREFTQILHVELKRSAQAVYKISQVERVIKLVQLNVGLTQYIVKIHLVSFRISHLSERLHSW